MLTPRIESIGTMYFNDVDKAASRSRIASRDAAALVKPRGDP